MVKHKSLAPELWAVAHKVSEKLTADGIDHVVIGGMAVGALGYERMTTDVDFLIREEDLGKLTGRPLAIGLSERVDGVRVDYIPIEEGETHLDVAVSDKGLVIAPPALVYLKLKAGRRKDQADVIELVKRGRLDLHAVRRYLYNLPFDPEDMIADFDALVIQADREGD